jgi:tetratricopeptide (TPR) repeat protein
MLYEQGSLQNQNGVWIVCGGGFSVPAKVRDVIGRRLDALRPIQRRLLDVASVIGEKFDPRLVTAVSAQNYIDVLETLNLIENSTRLVLNEGNLYRFEHAKYREMLYGVIPPLIKKEYHLRIAEKAEAGGEGFEQVSPSDIAYHYVECGNKKKAIGFSLAAGKDALLKFSNVEAAKHFRYVVEASANAAEFGKEMVEATEGLGDALYANSRYKEAIEAYESLLTQQEKNLQVRALRKAMDAAFFQGNFPYLLELTKKAGEYVASDRLESARVRINVGRALSNMGKPEALADFEAALQVFGEEYALQDVARTLMGIAIVAIMAGQREKALAAAVRSVALYEELGDLRGQMDANNRAGQAFYYCGFKDQALEKFDKAIELAEKIHDFNRMAEASAFSSFILEDRGDYQGALQRSLKAAEYAKQTDSNWTLGTIYSSLTRQYAKTKDIAHAEQYFNQLQELPPVTLQNPATAFMVTKAIFLAVKEQWQQAEQYFSQLTEMYKVCPGTLPLRLNYAWTLNLKGQVNEAKALFEEEQRVSQKIKAYFHNGAVQVHFIAPKTASTGEEFKVRIDIVNIAKDHIQTKAVTNLAPLELKFVNPIEVPEPKLGPLQTQIITVKLKATKTGVFNLTPTVTYEDDLGKIQKAEAKPLTVTVQRPTAGIEDDILPIKLEFNSDSARRAFEYLTSAFKTDYIQSRLPQERAGWRTLTEIKENAKVSKHSVYGSSGKCGQAVVELERLGLVEARIFMGERGRGGKVSKLRVAYEKENVKRFIERLQ